MGLGRSGTPSTTLSPNRESELRSFLWAALWIFPVAKVAGTISASAKIGAPNKTGGVGRVASGPWDFSGQLNKRIEKHVAKLRAEQITDTARYKSRRLCHIMSPWASLRMFYHPVPDQGDSAATERRSLESSTFFRAFSWCVPESP